jgi:biotin transporter BioY
MQTFVVAAFASRSSSFPRGTVLTSHSTLVLPVLAGALTGIGIADMVAPSLGFLVNLFVNAVVAGCLAARWWSPSLIAGAAIYSTDPLWLGDCEG